MNRAATEPLHPADPDDEVTSIHERATLGAEAPRRSRTRVQVLSVEPERSRRHDDWLATEEPLEIRVAAAGQTRSVAVTMRTPGADFELAAGFLLSERIVDSAERISRIEYCLDDDLTEEQRYNVVTVRLRGSMPPLATRDFTIASACGVCGRASIDDLLAGGVAPLPEGPVLSQSVITGLPDSMRERQRLFDSTGGLHAAALFDAEGRPLVLREDVGRHNAVDKVMGWTALNPGPTKDRAVLMVSGRTSFEIAQKCAVGRVPVLCAVSAPSSLAVEVARELNMTLIGFLRDDRFNVYAGASRLEGV